MNSAKNTNLFVLFLIIYQIAASAALQFIFPLIGVQSLGIMTIIMQAVVFLIPCALVAILNRHNIQNIFPFKNPGIINCFFAIGLCISIQPIMMFLSAFSALFFTNSIGDVVAAINDEKNLAFTLLVVALTPAICEELTLRGVILSGYKNSSIHIAALVNGLFFGIIHLNPQQFLYAFLLGAIFSYMVYYTKSIIPSIIAHFTINASQSILLYLFNLSGQLQAEAGAVVSFKEMIIAVVVLFFVAILTSPFFIAIFYFFIKHNEARNKENEQVQFPQNSQEKFFTLSFLGVIVLYILVIILLYIIVPTLN